MKKLLTILSLMLAIPILHAIPVCITNTDNILQLKAAKGRCGAVHITMKNLRPGIAQSLIFESSWHSEKQPDGVPLAQVTLQPNHSHVVKFDDGGIFTDGWYQIACEQLIETSGKTKRVDITQYVTIEPLGTTNFCPTAPGSYEPFGMNVSGWPSKMQLLIGAGVIVGAAAAVGIVGYCGKKYAKEKQEKIIKVRQEEENTEKRQDNAAKKVGTFRVQQEEKIEEIKKNSLYPAEQEKREAESAYRNLVDNKRKDFINNHPLKDDWKWNWEKDFSEFLKNDPEVQQVTAHIQQTKLDIENIKEGINQINAKINDKCKKYRSQRYPN